MLKIIQKWIDKHATPCNHIYWEVGKEDINNFLELKYSEGLKYKGMKLKLATDQVIFRNLKQDKTYWYIHSSGGLICDTLEPTHCGRKVVYNFTELNK